MKPWKPLKKCQVAVENRAYQKIKTLRTDRGGEFISHEFTSYCERVGIARQFTAPYNPQQNGVAEGRNRTIVDMARSMLKNKDLPGYLWVKL